MLTMMTSARLPASSEPMRACWPSTRAPPIVAISSASGALIARRIHGHQLLLERGLPHGLEHVEVVVAGGAVGAEPDVDAGFAVADDRRGAAGELHVAFRVVRDPDVALFEQRDLVVV